MLREEGQVGADEHGKEVHLAGPFGVLAARHLADPKIHPGEDTEHSTQRHHVVEVGDHIISVVVGPVYSGLRQHDAGHAASGEQEQEAEGEQHRRLEFNRATPHRGDP